MWGNFKNRGRPFNVMRAGDGFCGVFFDNDGIPRQDALYGTLALTGRGGEVSAKPEWSMGQRVDGIHDFWDDFSSDGRLSAEPARMGTAGQLDAWVEIRIGSLGSLERWSREEGVFEFCLSWCFPNRVKAWPAVQGIGQPGTGRHDAQLLRAQAPGCLGGGQPISGQIWSGWSARAAFSATPCSPARCLPMCLTPPRPISSVSEEHHVFPH